MIKVTCPLCGCVLVEEWAYSEGGVIADSLDICGGCETYRVEFSYGATRITVGDCVFGDTEDHLVEELIDAINGAGGIGTEWGNLIAWSPPELSDVETSADDVDIPF